MPRKLNRTPDVAFSSNKSLPRSFSTQLPSQIPPVIVTLRVFLPGKINTPLILLLGYFLPMDITPVYLRELAASIEAQQAAEQAAAEESGEAEDEIGEAETVFDDPSDAMAELEPANAELDSSFRAISENGITTILNLEHSGQADDMLKRKF